MSDSKLLQKIAELEALVAAQNAKLAAVHKTAKALYDTGVTARLLGVQLYNDLGEPLPEDSK
jgi:hypothetical protein